MFEALKELVPTDRLEGFLTRVTWIINPENARARIVGSFHACGLASPFFNPLPDFVVVSRGFAVAPICIPPLVELIESDPPLSDSKKNAAKTTQHELLRSNQRLEVFIARSINNLCYIDQTFLFSAVKFSTERTGWHRSCETIAWEIFINIECLRE